MDKFKLVRSFLALICVACIVFSSVFTASATPQTSSDVTWISLSQLAGIVKNKKELVFNIDVNGNAEKLHITFPSIGGIRINGTNKGFFEPNAVNEIKYTENANGTLTLSAGTGISAIVNVSSNPWSIKLCDKNGKTVTEYRGDTLWYGYKGTQLYRVCVENSLASGEVIYGLGERFNSFNRVGIKTEVVNTDAWSKDDTSYKNIPIIHSSKGYMFYFNTASIAIADIGTTDTKKYYYDVRGDKFDFFVYTDTPLNNISSYTKLTGTPMLPPKWAFHYMPGATTIGWESTKNPMSLLKGLVEGFEGYGITNIDGLFGEDAFRGNKAAYDYLNSKNIRMLAWNAPFQVDVAYRNGRLLELLPGHSSNFADYDLPIFRESDLSGYHGESSVDFSHPAAKEMVTNLWKTDIEYGLRGLMIDFGEHIGANQDLIAYNGMYAYEAHNFNSYYYAKTYYEVFNELIGEGEWLNYMRSGAPGSQAYATNFAGDQTSDFAGLTQAVNGMISLSTCGFSTYATDIGGLGGGHTADLYQRWLQMSTFSPLMRSHGSDKAEEPWQQGDMNIFLENYWLREALVDKIYSSAIIANKSGLPMVRAMALAYPDNKYLLACSDQYMFCDDFLVCPILTANTKNRFVYLPQGNWTDLKTGAIYEGGKTYEAVAPAEYIPVFIKAGAVIPVSVSKDTISLFDSKSDGNSLEALLVTAPNGSRTSEFWKDKSTKTTYKSAASGDTFTITADKAQSAEIVIAQGLNVTAVSVDGVKLQKLSSKAKATSTDGFYVNGRESTIINTPTKNWKSISITVGKSLNVDLAFGKKITTNEQRASTNKPEYINDGDMETAWQCIKDEYHIIVDLEEYVGITEVVLDWFSGLKIGCKVYTSEDGEKWTLAATLENSSSSRNVLKFNAINARYVKVGDFTSTGQKVSVANLEIYGDKAIGKAPDMSESDGKVDYTETVMPSYKVETDDKDETSSEINTSEETETPEKMPNERTDKTGGDDNYNKVIIIAIAIVGGALLVGAGILTTYFILSKRKGSKKAKETTQE